MEDKIIEKYKKLFNGEEKSLYEIMKECHQVLKNAEDMSFKLSDFCNEDKYKANMNTITLYRKYVKLDKFIEQNLFKEEDDKNTQIVVFNSNIAYDMSYHEIVDSLELYETEFPKCERFYIKNKIEKYPEKYNIYTINTINEMFRKDKEKVKIYFIKTLNKHYYVYNYNGFDFAFELPFNIIEESWKENKIYKGYMYLLDIFVKNNYDKIDKNKEYTNIYDYFGIDYEEYMKKSDYKSRVTGKFAVYNTTVKPFLIEKEGLTYYPDLTKISDGFFTDYIPMDLEDNNERSSKIEQMHKDFAEYFKTLRYDEEKIDTYLNENWIKFFDIGDAYSEYVNYNKVATKEELEDYRARIIRKKKSDIIFNIVLYKKWGIYKYGYNFSKKDNHKIEPNNVIKYKPYLKEYFELRMTNKKDFNTENDKRINLDNGIFRVSSKYFNSLYKNYEHRVMEDNILSNERGSSKEQMARKVYQLCGNYIDVDLVEFIKEYNEIKGENILNIDTDWYFPIHFIDEYVNNTVSCFCKERMTSSIEKYDVNILYDNPYINAFYPEENLNNTMITLYNETNKIEVRPKRPIFMFHHYIPYEKPIIPLVLSFDIDYKDILKIAEGKHPFFKSQRTEEEYKKSRALKIK